MFDPVPTLPVTAFYKGESQGVKALGKEAGPKTPSTFGKITKLRRRRLVRLPVRVLPGLTRNRKTRATGSRLRPKDNAFKFIPRIWKKPRSAIPTLQVLPNADSG
jgi:hypothetical protein